MAAVNQIRTPSLDSNVALANKTTSVEQKNEMRKVAETIVTAIYKKSAQPAKVAQLVQSFIDFAETGVRPSLKTIYEMDIELLLYSDLPDLPFADLVKYMDNLRQQCLQLSGYSREEVDKFIPVVLDQR